MHAAKNLTNSEGDFLLDINSELYNLLKNTPTFKNKLLGKAYSETVEYGEIVRYGVGAKTMGNMLLESGIIKANTKGILIEACNSGIITENGNNSAQIIANITRLQVKAPPILFILIMVKYLVL